jgi:hypothetical protein
LYLPLISIRNLKNITNVLIDPLELRVQFRQIVTWRLRDQFLQLLPQRCDAHRHVEPIQQVLGEWAQVQLQLPHVVATIGEKCDRLQCRDR